MSYVRALGCFYFDKIVSKAISQCPHTGSRTAPRTEVNINSQCVPVIEISASPLPPLHVIPGPHAVDGGAALLTGVLEVEVGVRPVLGALGSTEQVAEAEDNSIN